MYLFWTRTKSNNVKESCRIFVSLSLSFFFNRVALSSFHLIKQMNHKRVLNIKSLKPETCYKHWSEDPPPWTQNNQINSTCSHCNGGGRYNATTHLSPFILPGCTAGKQQPSEAQSNWLRTSSAPAPQHWINHTNFSRTNPYFTSKTLVPFLSCSSASVCTLICVMKYLIPFTGKREGTSYLLPSERRGGGKACLEKMIHHFNHFWLSSLLTRFF